MLTRIKLENFKSWRNLDIELAPLTLLFGTNSSGKTSIMQSVLMLKQTEEKRVVINFGGKNDDVKLGSFRDVVYDHNLDEQVSICLTWSKRTTSWSNTFVLSYENDAVTVETDLPIEDTFFDIVFNGPGIHYLGPLRQHPERSYLWSGAEPLKIEPNGENTIAALIASERSNDSLHNDVSQWLAKLGLADDFKLQPLDSDKRFYETRVQIADKINSLLDVGFGVSQILPVVTLLFFADEGAIIFIEQPELHLHPNAQAVLADLLLHVAETRNLQLIVESHSEHLLRRLQRRIAEDEYPFATPENIKMYFCNIEDGESKAHPVEVDQYGQINNWPENFFGDITGDLEAMTRAALHKVMNGGERR